MRAKKIKVLVVDDSVLFREVIARGISTDPDIEVVSKAIDPFDARDKILQYEPDVMTCDIEMPKMNGIEFIRRLLPQYAIPVIVVSTVSNAVFDAMRVGAVDFMNKPSIQSPRQVEVFIKDMINKIKIAANAKVIQQKGTDHPPGITKVYAPNQIIGIGASTGGTEAIHRILTNLPSTLPGIVIVQHIPPVFSHMFAERLREQTGFDVKEAKTGDVLQPGRVLIAPGEQHLRVKKVGERVKVEVCRGEKVTGHCPSVDVLFESLARECGENAIGIILTGMGYDGAKGLLAMKRRGAQTIGQDEGSSVVYGMPRVAYEIGAVQKQVSLSNIPRTLLAMLK